MALPLIVRIYLALSAVPLLALAAASLPVARTGTAHTLMAVAIGALIGASAARLAVPHVLTLIALAGTATAVPVAVVLVTAHADLMESAAVVSVLTLGLLAVLPMVAGHMAAMAVPRTQSAAGPAHSEEEFAWLVGRSHRVLVGSNVLCSVVLSACLLELGTAGHGFAQALAGCLSVTLLLRSGLLRARAAVLPVVAAGTLGLVTVIAHLPGYLKAPGWVGPLVVVVAGTAAVALGTTRSFRAVEAGERRASWPGTLASVLSVVCVPLAVGVFGVLEHLMHMGESL